MTQCGTKKLYTLKFCLIFWMKIIYLLLQIIMTIIRYCDNYLHFLTFGQKFGRRYYVNIYCI